MQILVSKDITSFW